MSTDNFYSEHAKELFASYTWVPFEKVHAGWMDLLAHTPSLILDIGAGSGRDANWLQKQGHEVVAVEPAHKLRGLGEQASAPGVLWIDDSLPSLSAVSKLNLTFDVILLSAVWMHIPPGERERAFRKIANLLKPGGLLIFSLRNQGFDDGRIFYPTQPEDLKELARSHVLEVVKEFVADDFIGRPGINWTILVFRLPDDGTGALSTLRHVIINDAKSSTYKLALLRVLVRIADSAQGLAVREGDKVIIPAGLVGLYWVRMFKPLLLDASKPIPQHPNPQVGFGFAKEGFAGLKGISPFDLRLGNRFSGDTARNLGKAIREAKNNIAIMPARFTTFPNSDKPLFQVIPAKPHGRPAACLNAEYLSSFGEFIIPAHIWQALSNLACWIEPVIVIEWCKLMAGYEKGDARYWADTRYLDALKWLDPEHDTGEVRQLVAKMRGEGKPLFCVWSKRALKADTDIDIDHALPFAFWPNNDLWNLMPCHSSVNRGQRGKFHKLISAETLQTSKGLIMEWWSEGYWRHGLEQRFQDEAQAALPGSRSLGLSDPLQSVFAGLEMQRMFLKRNQQIEEWSHR